MKATSEIRRRFWLVEMINTVDRRDDEVWAVRCGTKSAAATIASARASRILRVGRVVPARGGTETQRALAREFRTYCTKQIPTRA